MPLSPGLACLSGINLTSKAEKPNLKKKKKKRRGRNLNIMV